MLTFFLAGLRRHRWVLDEPQEEEDEETAVDTYSCPAAGVASQAAHPLDSFYQFGVLLARRKELRPQVAGEADATGEHGRLLTFFLDGLRRAHRWLRCAAQR